jgi:hypothetical protein
MGSTAAAILYIFLGCLHVAIVVLVVAAVVGVAVPVSLDSL